MSEANLNVTLRLLLDQVQGDAAKAAAIIKQQLGAELGGGLSGGKTSRDVSDMARSFAATGKVTAKMASDMDKISSISSDIAKANKKMGGNIFGKEGGAKDFWKMNQHLLSPQVEGGGSGRIRINLDEQRKKAQAKSDEDMVTFKKDMSFLAMPLFNPGSMWATLFSTRQTYSAMNTEHGAAFRQSNLRGMGAGAATALLVASATAAGLVLKALSKTVQETIAAYEKARQLYAKSLMSGLGVELTTKRGMLANIMGVSEEDVLKFGGAMSYLNPKIEWASKVLAQTANPLTEVSWNFKIMDANLQAMFSTLAVEAAPAMKVFTDAVSDFAKWVSEHGHNLAKQWLGEGWVTENTAEKKNRMDSDFVNQNYYKYKGVDGFGSGEGALKKLMPDTGSGHYADDFRKKFGAWSLKNFEQMAQGLGVDKMKAGEIYSWMKKPPGEAGKLGSDMPSPQQFMKTLPTSAWEKMGLVIGGKGSGVNELLRESNKQLSIIAKAVTGAGGGVPRSFGMSPTVANS